MSSLETLLFSFFPFLCVCVCVCVFPIMIERAWKCVRFDECRIVQGSWVPLSDADRCQWNGNSHVHWNCSRLCDKLSLEFCKQIPIWTGLRPTSAADLKRDDGFVSPAWGRF